MIDRATTLAADVVFTFFAMLIVALLAPERPRA